MVELMVVMLIATVMLGTVVVNLKSLNNPLLNASNQLQSQFKKTRAKAIATTLAYKIAPISTTQIGSYSGTNCNNAITQDTAMTLELPSGSHLTDVNWEVCFNTRGILDTDLQIELQDQDNHLRTIEVLLGGSVREL